MKPYEHEGRHRKVHRDRGRTQDIWFHYNQQEVPGGVATCILQVTKPKFGEVTDLPKVPQWKSMDLNWVSRWVSPKLGEG